MTDGPAMATHALVRHQQQPSYSAVMELVGSPVPALVSPVWLLGCMEAGRLLDPGSHPLLRPLPAPGVPGGDAVHASLTGYAGAARGITLCLLRCAGFRASKAMQVSAATHLLASERGQQSGSGTQPAQISKLGVARSHGIAVVGLAWLLACLQNWTVVPPGLFRVLGSPTGRDVAAGGTPHAPPLSVHLSTPPNTAAHLIPAPTPPAPHTQATCARGTRTRAWRTSCRN